MRSSFVIGDISPLRLVWIDSTDDGGDAEYPETERPAA